MTDITVTDIQSIIDANWQQGFGNISAQEAMFIRSHIEEYKPSIFIEIGVASGISTGLTALAMAENGGERVIGIDINPNFLGEPTGRKAASIHRKATPSIELHLRNTALDASQIMGARRAQMAFIDGNHQHPWPTLDMIALLPFMDPNAVLIFHDLALFKRQAKVVSIGPKFLYDQFPDSRRRVSPRDAGANIFSITLRGDHRSCEDALINSLLIPWTNTDNIPLKAAMKTLAIMEKHYGTGLTQAFEIAWSRFA